MKNLAIVALLLLVIAASSPLRGQQAASTSSDLKTWTTAEDHQNMLAQLGIRKLRQGRAATSRRPITRTTTR
jgi:hypothetical protein